MLQKHQKVFGLGLSRTGTKSLFRALNILGIKTIHFPSDKKTFAELKKGNYRLSVMNKFQGAVDISVAPYYAQLDQVYPGSKFILTVRQIDSWIRSIQNLRRITEASSRRPRPFIEFIRAAVYGTVEFNEDRFRFVYRMHTQNVRDYFSDRLQDLLVLDICDGEGWEKLCPFLNLPAPDSPFPRLNQLDRSEDWEAAVESAAASVRTIIPEGADFVLVGHGRLDKKIEGAFPFMSRNGNDWGPPPDDESAILEAETLRANGPHFLVFLFPFFWWLDHYRKFRQYLRTNAECVAKNDQMIVFKLRS